MTRIISVFTKILSICISALVFVLSPIAYLNTDVSATNTSVEYTVFNASDGLKKRSYTLDPNSVVDKSRGVFYPDDRVHDEILNEVVEIYTEGYVHVSSGFIIDSHTIATAAHCVYDGDGSVEDSKMKVKKVIIYNESGTEPMQTITNISEVHVPNTYINDTTHLHCYDYALITVSDDLSAYVDFSLDFGAIMNDFNTDVKVYCTGYPGDLDSGRIVSNGYISKLNSTEIKHKIDTYPGSSGGPIYLATKYMGNTYYSVIGIVSTSSGSFITNEDGTITFVPRINTALRITTDQIHFYKNNPNLEY